MPPSIKDVALRSGVSFKTVSRVINDEPHVGETTKARVLDAIEELGYRTNHEARGLRRGRTRTLRLVIRAQAERFLANPFQDDVVSGVVDEASRHGYAVLLEVLRRPNTGDVQASVARQADGSIVLDSSVPFTLGPSPRTTCEPAVVLANRDVGDGLGWIDADFRGGAVKLAEHLIGLGHTRICHFTDNPVLLSSQERRAGYEQALQEASIPVDPDRVVMTDGMREGGYRAAERLISSGSRFTAILAVNDLTALGAIDCLRQHGLSIPSDISVTGYDDIYLARYVTPALTTAHIPWYEMGARAVDCLVKMIEDGEGLTGDLFPVRLCIRGTTARAPQAVNE